VINAIEAIVVVVSLAANLRLDRHAEPAPAATL
jgi:hypothetical protein